MQATIFSLLGQEIIRFPSKMLPYFDSRARHVEKVYATTTCQMTWPADSLSHLATSIFCAKPTENLLEIRLTAFEIVNDMVVRMTSLC